MSDWYRGMDETIEELLRDIGVDEPPVDAEWIAERLGVPVFEQEELQERGRLVGTANAATIVVRSEPRDERTQYSIAHELGELFVGDVCRRAGESPEFVSARQIEEIAHRFAERLLCPETWFTREARRCRFDVPGLKSIFQTASHEVIALRTLHCEIPTAITVFDNGRQIRRKSNMNGTPRLSPLELEAWQSAHESGAPVTICRGAVNVQAWPVWEGDWKREILRTTADATEVGDC